MCFVFITESRAVSVEPDTMCGEGKQGKCDVDGYDFESRAVNESASAQS
jgi:hypothetical protein